MSEKLPALYCVYDTFSKKWYAGEQQTPPIHFKGEYPALYIPAAAIRALIELTEIESLSDFETRRRFRELLSEYASADKEG